MLTILLLLHYDAVYVRPAHPEDQIAIMALINVVYHEYGDCLCLENADRDRLDIDATLLDFIGNSVYSGHAELQQVARPPP